jgi:formate--tetrahydrofolate ligase
MGNEQHQHPKSDIEIARAAKLDNISKISDKLGVPGDGLLPYGHVKAKIDPEYAETLKGKADGKLILVAGITPTPAGEGKTTTSVGLGDALNDLGHNAAICLREPSLGPCFGIKGGAAGGGYAQVVPMEEINLHFNGDFHAITSAHNLLSAMIDNHVHWGNDLGIDTRRVTWKRVVDMNDRALRNITNGLGGVGNGFPREDGFDITVASEVMAIFCLADDLADLQERLGNIVVAYTRKREPIRARDLQAEGAMTVLLKNAMGPNLVQTLEGTPAFVHGGPFANIAHGCNSVAATRTALKLADYVVTEAGFGADLGAEKFFDIKCRKSGLTPDACVVVATIRAVKMHGGLAKEELKQEHVEAVKKGAENVRRHVQNITKYGVPPVVAVNKFSADTDAEVEALRQCVAQDGVELVVSDHWANGGPGAVELASTVVRTIDEQPSNFKLLYSDDLPLWDKIRTVATELYGAADISADDKVKNQLQTLQDSGYGHYPVCIAKTPLSLSTDPGLKGAPEGHTVAVREVRLSAGAEFLVIVCGDVMTMPGLPRVPAAAHIHLGEDGNIEGLF